MTGSLIRQERPTPSPRRAAGTLVVLSLLFVTLALPPAPAVAQARPSSSPTTDGQARMTVDQEIQIGRDLAASVRRMNGGAWNNPAALERIRTIGARLVAVSDRHEVEKLRRNYSFELCATRNVNAMALPGGMTFVTRGLMELNLSDDELACVLAHEIAHAARRHGAINFETDKRLKASIAARHKSRVLRLLGRVGTFFYIRKRLDPNLEHEADYYGQLYAARAGYNPNGMVTLFERFQRMEGSGKRRLSQRILVMLLDNHPPTAERVSRARTLAGKLQRRESVPTTPVPVYQ